MVNLNQCRGPSIDVITYLTLKAVTNSYRWIFTPPVHTHSPATIHTHIQPLLEMFVKMTLKWHPSTKTTQSWQFNHMESKHGWKIQRRGSVTDLNAKIWACRWAVTCIKASNIVWLACKVAQERGEGRESGSRHNHTLDIVGSLLPVSCQSNGCPLRISVVEG